MSSTSTLGGPECGSGCRTCSVPARPRSPTSGSRSRPDRRWPTTVAGSSRRVRFGGARAVDRAGRRASAARTRSRCRSSPRRTSRSASTRRPRPGPRRSPAASTTPTTSPVRGDATAATDGRELPGHELRLVLDRRCRRRSRVIRDAGAVVALGDSITAGFDSTENANVGWVDLLADRLQAAHTSPPLSVLNAGHLGQQPARVQPVLRPERTGSACSATCSSSPASVT